MPPTFEQLKIRARAENAPPDTVSLEDVLLHVRWDQVAKARRKWMPCWIRWASYVGSLRLPHLPALNPLVSRVITAYAIVLVAIVGAACGLAYCGARTQSGLALVTPAIDATNPSTSRIVQLPHNKPAFASPMAETATSQKDSTDWQVVSAFANSHDGPEQALDVVFADPPPANVPQTSTGIEIFAGISYDVPDGGCSHWSDSMDTDITTLNLVVHGVSFDINPDLDGGLLHLSSIRGDQAGHGEFYFAGGPIGFTHPGVDGENTFEDDLSGIGLIDVGEILELRLVLSDYHPNNLETPAGLSTWFSNDENLVFTINRGAVPEISTCYLAAVCFVVLAASRFRRSR